MNGQRKGHQSIESGLLLSPQELPNGPQGSLPTEVLLPVPQSAWDLLIREQQQDTSISTPRNTGIATGSEAFDNILGGSGIPLGGITEICGLPGIGKTQLA
jgi:hypothetical protein